MQPAIDQFRNDILRAKNLALIYQFLKSQSTSALKIDDLLRTEILIAVSALDLLIHEMTVTGMNHCVQGKRPPTLQFNNYKVSIETVVKSINGILPVDWLNAEVRSQHQHKSFQQPDKIAEAIKLFSIVELWKEVATEMGEDADTVKRKVKLIIDRRNKIAHESDCDPTNSNQRWPIDEIIADDAVDYISKIGEAIYKVV